MPWLRSRICAAGAAPVASGHHWLCCASTVAALWVQAGTAL